ncbi:hypothetical protein [Leuconostoc mesenteroides]|uniref:hypothetical protein n=1 Tax=Leuconostoc mesenteroides TaxID=1245 RepID=UPI0006830E72|nr:hypothetical protein [Leuconostoc mesenteroides]KMY76913.1 hypothetical protein WZ79_10045 [Leuconostoc mesenteroides subsp. mesenteroides]
MTFDEALDEMNADQEPSEAIRFMERLRDIYAPTVKMTKEQRKGLLFDGKGRETPHKNFVFMKEVQKVNEKNINIDILMSAFVHPETIKIVDE